MRIKQAKVIIILAVILNLLLLYNTWKEKFWDRILASTAFSRIMSADIKQSTKAVRLPNANMVIKEKANGFKHIKKSLTIVFRNLYAFENDLKDSISSIQNIIVNMPIVVLQDGMTYPPLILERNNSLKTMGANVLFVNLEFDLWKTAQSLNPLNAIRTKYALFMPDSVRINSKSILQKLLKELVHDIQNSIKGSLRPDNKAVEMTRKVVIVPFAENRKSLADCIQIELDVPNWTIQYEAVTSNSSKCDLYLHKHAILVDVALLKQMPDPLAAPFPEMFYIQAKFHNITKVLYPYQFQNGRRLFATNHTKELLRDIRRHQFRNMYKKLFIKRVIRRAHKISSKADKTSKLKASNLQHIALDSQFSSANTSLPLVTEIDLIGCERTTKSCIGFVHNQKPFYIYQGKHTPPCCLHKLKTTFNHVLEEFENVGIRYWLDNLGLKTAIETNELSPDAYDIDISFNINDLDRSNALHRSQNKPYVDGEGFYWMKATDGNYFRVHFSKINQIGVNLLPYVINGNNVEPMGFFGWKAKTFSSAFLHPMSTVRLFDKNIMCPNNVRQYLEYKNL